MTNSRSTIAISLRAMGVALISMAEKLGSESEELGQPLQRSPRASSEWLFHHHREAVIALAKKEFDDRARRSRFIEARLLGEPVWDILLYLFPRREAGVVSFTTQVCSASGVPATTGLRYVSILVEQKFLSVSVCPFDARRTEVHLTDTGRSLVLRCLLDRLDRLDLPWTVPDGSKNSGVVIPLHQRDEPLVKDL